MTDVKKPKTWKREYAVLLTAFWMGMAIYAVYANSENAMQIVEVVTIPILSISALCFGLDWKGKQA